MEEKPITLSWMDKLRELNKIYPPEVTIGLLYKYGKKEEEYINDRLRFRLKGNRV